ncbi:MAG: outer membrane lipoprotein-sorting protein [Bdellovibrionales bacterium]|nr:outer membrane lipoprotein-sorting protein [Bdellovibrionales bacterium]
MKLILCIFLLLYPILSFAETPTEIVKTIEKKLMPPNITFSFKLTNHRTDGTVNSYVLSFKLKDLDQSRGYFLEPEREKGREVLRQGEAIWTFVPSVGRSIRIADRDSFAGGDFSNADILRPDWTDKYAVTLAKETPNQWIFNLNSKSKDSAYNKMRLWIDKNSKQPVQQTFYDAKGTLLKKCVYGPSKIFTGTERPALLVMYNVITKQKTELEILSMKTQQKHEDRIFAVGNLGK